MKVVDLVARIPEHLDLHFSDFSTILYGIYKFAVFENKRKRKGNLASRPLDFYFFSPWVPGRGLKQGRQWRPDSDAYGGRRRGGIGGGARGGREGPRGGLGWARDGRSGRLRGEQRPAAADGGGGGGLVAVGDGERVEEHRWGSRKLAGGSFGREEGWRKGFRGSLGGGGANGGIGCSGRHGRARPGAQSKEERAGEVGGVLATQMGGRRAEQG